MVSEFGLSSMLLVMVVPTAGLPLMYLQVVYGPPTGELTYYYYSNKAAAHVQYFSLC